MHAVVISVTINEREAATRNLRERVVPTVSSAPGFVTGYWVALPPNQGRATIVFESEEAARGLVDQLPPPDDAVTIDSTDVGEVVAHA
jgi:hypothetical protein